MLKVTIPSSELFDETTQSFVYTKEQTLSMEHSLVSLSKWEAKWNKPFLSKEEKTQEETLDYFRCMTITQDVDPDIYKYMPPIIINQIEAYIKAPMTATTFYEDSVKGGSKGSSKEIITSELVYYWMIANNIPMECQKWHLNRLLTLIRVCSIKNAPPKKTSKRELASRYASLNAARRKKLNTSG